MSAVLVLRPDRRPYSQAASDVTPASDFRCCVKGCRHRVAKTGSGWCLPVCAGHGAMLSPALFDDVAAAAAGSPFNASTVLEAALLVKKVQARCEQVSRRGKAKRKHA